MSLTLYDTGFLFYVPPQGAPIKVGALENINLTMERDLVINHGQFQQPIRALNGHGTIEGVARGAKLDGRVLTELYFGQAATAGAIKVKLAQAFTVPATPFEVPATPPSGTFYTDLGVTSSGAALVKVDSAPASGEYSVNPATGVYTFNVAQQGVAVQISFAYQVSTGYSLDLTNPLTQLAPTFGVMLMNKYSCEQSNIWLPRCASSQFGLEGRLEEYGITDFKFTVIADPSSRRVGIFSYGG